MNNKIQLILQQVITPARITSAILALLSLFAFWTWTATPSPASASANVVVGTASLSASYEWAASTTQIDRQSTLTISVNQPQYETSIEFPTLDQQIDAWAGSATCLVVRQNVFGHTIIQAGSTVDFMLDINGVTIATPQAFSSGNVYSVSATIASQSDADGASNGSAPYQVIVTRITVDLGSNSGANLGEYTMYLSMTISETGQITCSLRVSPQSPAAPSGVRPVAQPSSESMVPVVAPATHRRHVTDSRPAIQRHVGRSPHRPRA